MAGRYTSSYLGRSNGWRAVAILADTGQASLVGRIPGLIMDWLARGNQHGAAPPLMKALDQGCGTIVAQSGPAPEIGID
ncbi:MAG: hypothetical protein ACRECX_11665 [Methyloceanibacter sp.]|uniref:hypothetical protein n=1 Tax=Methyloceanibacter sp. TaxID=1965321 RepID=UPI003D6C92FC